MSSNDKKSGHQLRRKFLKQVSLGIGAGITGLYHMPVFAQTAGSKKIRQNVKKLNIALVGLGSYSRGQLAPALQETKFCQLSGIVTGTPSKIPEWQRNYSITDENVYSYENFDEIARNDAIDIIYIVLPPGMHAEYTIRAAEAGKHVICEKPMATSVEDCQRMIDACKKNNVMLSIGYRLHYEPYNRHIMEIGQQEKFGPVKKIDASNSFRLSSTGVWRLDKQLAGGGPLMDMGIYCVQGANYTMGESPVSVKARFEENTRPAMFTEVEEAISWTIEYDNGAIATCDTNYRERTSKLSGAAERGHWELNPAYSYGGISGSTSEGQLSFPQVNQQALQMDAFAQNVLNKEASIVPGEMGKEDIRILMAIYEAANSGAEVRL